MHEVIYPTAIEHLQTDIETLSQQIEDLKEEISQKKTAILTLAQTYDKELKDRAELMINWITTAGLSCTNVYSIGVQDDDCARYEVMDLDKKFGCKIHIGRVDGHICMYFYQDYTDTPEGQDFIDKVKELCTDVIKHHFDNL